MSHWTIDCAGTRDGVLQYLRSAAACCPVAHASFERARSLLLAEVSRVTTNGVTVQADGDIDRITQITVTDLDLMLAAAGPPKRDTRRPLPETATDGPLRFAEASVRNADFGGDGAAVRPAYRSERRP